MKRSEPLCVIEYSAIADETGDPAKNFENPDEYMHVFSADEASGYRMASAIFDAKVRLRSSILH